MKYLYYIAGIIILFSLLAGYGLKKTRVDISSPVIIVNDRIISETEYKNLLKLKPYYMNDSEYKDSLITRQLLIQEAVAQKINKEESFRQSVESFYEQSLIKILMDRTAQQLEAGVSDDELARYEKLLQSRVILVKNIFATPEDARTDQNAQTKTLESPFSDLAGALKYMVLNLKKGETSPAQTSDYGVVKYQLKDVIPLDPKDRGLEMDKARVIQFLVEKKKEALLEDWITDLKKMLTFGGKNEPVH